MIKRVIKDKLSNLEAKFKDECPVIESCELDNAPDKDVELGYNINLITMIYGETDTSIGVETAINCMHQFSPTLRFIIGIAIQCKWVPDEYYLKLIWSKKEKTEGSILLLEYCLGDDIDSDSNSDVSSD
jgi:hypothetical protein